MEKYADINPEYTPATDTPAKTATAKTPTVAELDNDFTKKAAEAVSCRGKCACSDKKSAQ